MPFRTEKAGFEKDDQYDVFIATLQEGAPWSSPGAISHIPGTDVVCISGNVPGCGVTELKGRDQLILLRDALIEICKRENLA